MPPETLSRPWRRILRFSVRALLVLVLVIGVSLGWIVQSAHIQRNAVAAIKNAGGRAYYVWEWNNSTRIPGGTPRVPAWLWDRIGVDYFGHVVAVEGPASMTQSDAVMAAVGRLTRIEYLRINQLYFTDPDLAQITRLNNLHEPFVSNGQLTDAGAAALDALSKLSYLRVSGTPQVTDAGLAHLKGLGELSTLDVNGTQVTDTGLVHLKGLPKLSFLLLINTQVSDAGVNELQQSLPSLWISR